MMKISRAKLEVEVETRNHQLGPTSFGWDTLKEKEQNWKSRAGGEYSERLVEGKKVSEPVQQEPYPLHPIQSEQTSRLNLSPATRRLLTGASLAPGDHSRMGIRYGSGKVGVTNGGVITTWGKPHS